MLAYYHSSSFWVKIYDESGSDWSTVIKFVDIICLLHSF